MTTCYSCYREVTEQGTWCIKCKNVIHADCGIKDGVTLVCDTCYMMQTAEPAKPDVQVPDVIRRTYIETYRACPYKFLKEVIEGNQSPPTCYTQIGIDLHDLFEKAINDRSYHELSMVDDFSAIWYDVYPSMNLFADKEQEDKMWERSMNSIQGFYQTIADMPMPFITEQTIHYEIGEGFPKVEFTMDVVMECEDGELEIHDWKTGKVMTGQKLSTDLQPPLYIYGVQKHFNRPVKRFVLHYVSENKKRVYERVAHNLYVCKVGKREYHIDLEDMVKEVRRVFSQIMKGNFNIPADAKKMFFTCKMCHLREQGVCQGAEVQAWHNAW